MSDMRVTGFAYASPSDMERDEMYAKDDPRANLNANATAVAPKAAEGFAGASYGRFYETEPQEKVSEGETWYWRGQNLVVAYSKARDGLVLERAGQVDEYVLMIPNEDVTATVTWKDESETVTGPYLVFIPKGDSRIEIKGGGDVFRLITTQNADVAAKCANAGDYAAGEHDPNVPPFEEWPAPVGGEHLRTYSGNYPNQPGRFGRLFRGQTVMVNFGNGRPGKRDRTKLSPHFHEDFEQYSVATAGEYIHHVRWPWTPNGEHWRADEHEYCNSPSVAVLPPPAVHTSEGTNPGLNRLCDVFSPPRRDFSAQPGWVINADEYPAPADLVMKSGGGSAE
jgi:hypothetical protein